MYSVSNKIFPGVHLTRFWSGTCHRGFKNIPVPYTNFLKTYTRPELIPIFRQSISDLIFHSKILQIGTVPYTKIVKIDTVLYTNIWKIDALPNGTSPYPKYVQCTPREDLPCKCSQRATIQMFSMRISAFSQIPCDINFEIDFHLWVMPNILCGFALSSFTI